jgi:hypothetical protein
VIIPKPGSGSILATTKCAVSASSISTTGVLTPADSANAAIARCRRSTKASCGPSGTGVQSSGMTRAYNAGINGKAIICVPLGHRWETDTESHEVEPILRCARCGRHRNMGSEMRNATPWTGRSASPTGRMSGGTGRDGRPY